MTIARYYVEENNPEGAHFPGVGLRDLTEEEWAVVPEAIQKDVDASKLYRKTKPQGWKAAPEYESGVKPKSAKKEDDGVPVSVVAVAEPVQPVQVVPAVAVAEPAKEGGK